MEIGEAREAEVTRWVGAKLLTRSLLLSRTSPADVIYSRYQPGELQWSWRSAAYCGDTHFHTFGPDASWPPWIPAFHTRSLPWHVRIAAAKVPARDNIEVQDGTGGEENQKGKRHGIIDK